MTDSERWALLGYTNCMQKIILLKRSCIMCLLSYEISLFLCFHCLAFQILFLYYCGNWNHAKNVSNLEEIFPQGLKRFDMISISAIIQEEFNILFSSEINYGNISHVFLLLSIAMNAFLYHCFICYLYFLLVTECWQKLQKISRDKFCIWSKIMWLFRSHTFI